MPAKLSEVSLSVENRVELRALCNMLELASGFTLGFVRVNHSGLRERLVDEIRRRLPQMQIQEIQLDRQSRAGVVAQLEDRLGDAHPGALFVHGLEGMFDPSLEQSPKLDILNLNRDFFAKRFPWPVVFWVPEFAMREFSRQAPDFWSWRSGTYHFVGQEGDAGETLQQLPGADVWNIDLREKRERREILEHLEAELSASGHSDDRLLADTYYLLGQANYYEDRDSQAAQYFEKALPLLRELGDKRGEANCIRRSGDVALQQGRHEQAEASYKQALPIYREIGARMGEANCIQSLGDVALQQGRHEQAEASYKQALPIYREIGARLGGANCIRSLGDVALQQDRYEQAEASYNQALAIYREIGDRLGEANGIQRLGDVALRQDRYEQAEASYNQALPIYREIGARLSEANGIQSLGDVALGQGRYEQAEASYNQALPIYREIGDRLGEANTLLSMGRLARATGKQEQMRSSFQQAETIYKSIGNDHWAQVARQEAVSHNEPQV